MMETLFLSHLYEEDPVAEAEAEFVKEFNILQKVVVACTRVAVLVVVPDHNISRLTKATGDSLAMNKTWMQKKQCTDQYDMINICQHCWTNNHSTTIYILLPIDEQLYNRLHVVGRDQGLLLPLAGDQGHSTDRHHIRTLENH